MFGLLVFLPVLLLFFGCVSTGSTFQGKPTESAVINTWFEELNRENFVLHDILLRALFISRQTGKVVYVRRVEAEGAKIPPRLYRVSLERGGSDNLVGVNFAMREFLFDHFLPSDGPNLNQTRRSLRYGERIRELKKDLGIFGIK
jgi:hypothetical protein